MTGVPEVFGSHALWAAWRLLEMAWSDILSPPGVAFLAGAVAAVVLRLRRSGVLPLPTLARLRLRGWLSRASSADEEALSSPYQMLARKLPDRDVRERLISEQVNSGSASSRIEAIHNLLASSLPPELTTRSQGPARAQPVTVGQFSQEEPGSPAGQLRRG